MTQRWGGFLCMFAYVALGQQAPTPGSPDVVFRATTKLVQVSVIAEDKKGQPIADLRREEFQIFDNGSPQKIQLFIAETAQSSPALMEARAPGTFTNRLAAPTGSHSGYSVILFDNLVTGFGTPDEDGTGFGVQKVLRALQTIPEGEKIALYAVGWKLQIVREFTTDRESLEQKLKMWTPAVDTADLTYCDGGSSTTRPPLPDGVPGSRRPVRNHVPVDPGVDAANLRAASECARIDMVRRFSSFGEQLEQMADHLAGIPGRKNLIWMANEFPILGGPAVQRLMNAGVSIYPVDEAGVCRVCPTRPKQQMRALAELTGGVPYFERNDLDVAVREAIDDGRVSYTLGFYQPGDDQTPTIHQLKVKVSRPDVTLRYRTAYQTDSPEPVSTSRVADLLKAMNRPVDATVIPISASATRIRDRLDLMVSFDVSSLGLELEGGLWKGKAELVVRFVTADGVQAGDVLSQAVTFNLRPATYSSMLQNGGVPYHKEMKIPAKAVELKVLVSNLASRKIGTLTIPLSEVSAKSN